MHAICLEPAQTPTTCLPIVPNAKRAPDWGTHIRHDAPESTTGDRSASSRISLNGASSSPGCKLKLKGTRSIANLFLPSLDEPSPPPHHGHQQQPSPFLRRWGDINAAAAAASGSGSGAQQFRGTPEPESGGGALGGHSPRALPAVSGPPPPLSRAAHGQPEQAGFVAQGEEPMEALQLV